MKKKTKKIDKKPKVVKINSKQGLLNRVNKTFC